MKFQTLDLKIGNSCKMNHIKALSATLAEACLLEEILQNQRATNLILIILHKKSDANQMKHVFSTDGKNRPQNSVRK